MKRALGILLVLLLLVAAVGGVVAWREAPRLMEHAIRAGAGWLGYQDVRVEVSAVGLRETRIARFSVGPAPGLKASEIALGYGPRTLLLGRVLSVHVADATLHGVFTEAGVEFPALPPGEEGPWIAPTVFDRAQIDRARVELAGEPGPATITLRGIDVGTPPGARMRLRGHAAVARPAADLSADVDLVLDGDRVNGSATLKAKDGSLDVRADFGAPGPEPGRFPDVAGPEALKVEGHVDLTAKEADLSPFTPSLTAKGRIDLAMRDGHLRVRSDSLDLAGFGLDLSGLGIDVDLAGVSPPVAPPGQRISVRTARVGMDIGGGVLRFGIGPDGVISIDSLDWQLHGGRLTTSGRYDPAAASNALVLHLEAVDLERLVGALDRPDLAASGVLAGDLPLRIEGDRIFATGGRLMASEAGGVIRYQPNGPRDPAQKPPAKGAVGGMSLVMDALENFHYRKLRVEVDGELTGEMKLFVQLEGSNPDVYEGYPFQVNLNLEGPLADVVQGGTTGFRIQDAIEERFRKRGEKR